MKKTMLWNAIKRIGRGAHSVVSHPITQASCAVANTAFYLLYRRREKERKMQSLIGKWEKIEEKWNGNGQDTTMKMECIELDDMMQTAQNTLHP